VTGDRPPLPLEMAMELDRIRRRSSERKPKSRAPRGMPRTAAAPPPPRATDTHCRNGHPWEGNEYFKPSRPNVRRCRACVSEQMKKARSGD